MKSYRKELWFNAAHRREFINITPQVQHLLGHTELKMATLDVQDISKQTDIIIENSRNQVI